MELTVRNMVVTKPRRLDRRNPFRFYTYRYGYFLAFLAGGGTATVDQLMESALRTRLACGITTDTVKKVRKDIADHKDVWKEPVTVPKNAYKLTVVVNMGGSMTCTHVADVPWDEYLDGKVR